MNEYDQLIGASVVESNATSSLNKSLSYAVDRNPEETAKILKVAREFGVDLDIAGDPSVRSQMDRAARMRRIDVDSLIKSHPRTAAFLSNPENASIAHDDVQSMTKMERTLTGTLQDVGVGYLKYVMAAPTAVHGAASLAFGSADDDRADSMNDDLNPDSWMVTGKSLKAIREVVDSWHSDAQKAANKRVKDAQGFGDTAGALLSNPSTIAINLAESWGGMRVGAGIGGLLVNSPLRVAPFVGGAIGEGLVQASQMAGDVRLESGGNLTPLQRVLSLGSGLVTGSISLGTGKLAASNIGRRLGLDDIDTAMTRGTLLSQLTAPKQGFAAGAGRVGKNMIAEGLLEETPQSYTEQIFQNLAMGKPWHEGVDKAAATGLITGAAMGGGFAKAQIFSERMQQAQQAEVYKGFFAALSEGATESELLKRLPEKFRELVKNYTKDGPLQNVYVDGEQFRTYFQTEGTDAREFAQRMGVTNYDESIGAGHPLAIPMDGFMAEIASGKHMMGLLPDLKLSPVEMSIREAQAANDDFEQRLDNLKAEMAGFEAEAKNESALSANIRKIVNDISGQLQGRYDRKTADTMAALMRGVAVVAQREAQAKAKEQGREATQEEINERINAEWAKRNLVIRPLPLPDILTKVDRYDPTFDHLLDRLRTGDIPTEQGLSLADFIRKIGGINAYWAGELTDIDKGRMPFQKNIIQENGVQDDEALAQAKEAGYLPPDATTDDLIAALNDGGDIYSALDQPLHEADLINTLGALDEELRNAGIDLNQLGNEAVRKLLFGDGVQYEQRSEATKQAYESRIDGLFAGEKANEQGVVVLDKSDVLDMLGFGGGPVMLAEGKLRAGINNHPLITAEHWKKIPDWLDNPAAVFKSDTVDGRLVFIAPEMVGGATVRIVVEPNAPDRSTGLTVHLLQNAYDAQGKTPFARWFGDELGVYVDQKKFPIVLSRLGLQLPNVVTSKPGSKNILTEKNLAGYRRNSEKFYQSERNLVVQHNLTAENLLHAVKVGGLAVPSLAVAHKSHPMQSFGEITLVAHSDMIDPKVSSKTKTFGADIYSPRYPSISYRLDKVALSKINALLAQHREDGEREIYGGEIERIDDITGNKAFKRYVAAKFGDDYKYSDMKSAAAAIMQQVGAEERIFQGYTYSGNRKYVPHTLDSVIKILKKELRGGENFNYGVGSVRAKMTPQFRSIAQIKKESGRLVDKDTFEQVKKEVDSEFFAIADGLKGFHPASNHFGFYDSASMMMGDAAKMGIHRALSANGFDDVSQEKMIEVRDFLNKLRNLPTEYFEAKVLGALPIGEFAAAVIPDSSTPEVIEAIKAQGIEDIRTYENGNEQDRAAKIGELEHIFFQRDLNKYKQGSLTISPDKTMRIDLFAKANFSTFAHEVGHFYLEMMADLASEEGASQYAKGEWAAILKFLGVNSREEIKTEHHEKFARANEAYLMEGKSPSPELKSVFTRFKNWLTRIYEQMVNLDVKLSNEIRAVFDRIYATDAEINLAKAENAYVELFTTAEDLGLSQAVFDIYKKASEREIEGATEELLTKVMRVKVQEHTAWWVQQLDRVTKEVTKEVDALPSYAAFKELSASGGLKLSRFDLESRYGKAILGRLLRGYGKGRGAVYADDGVSLESAAEMLGFQSADEMVGALASLRPRDAFIKAEAQRRMYERHNDLLSSAEISDETQLALHNEARAEKLAIEIKAIDKRRIIAERVAKIAVKEAVTEDQKAQVTKERWAQAEREMVDQIKRAAAAMPSLAVYQAAAIESLNGKSLSEIQPHVYLSAMRKHSREAFQAMARNDYQKARDAKHKELLNHYLYREAVKAQKSVAASMRLFKRIRSGSDAKLAKSRDMVYLNLARSLLADYGIGDGSKARAYLEVVSQYEPIPEFGKEGKPFKSLKFGEFQAFADEVKALWEMSRREMTVEIDGKTVAKEVAIDALLAQLHKNGVPPRIPGEGYAVTESEERKTIFTSYFAAMTRAEQFFDRLDGSTKLGAFTKFLFQPIKEAAELARDQQGKALKQYLSLLSTVEIKEELFDAPELGYIFGKGHGNQGKVELLHAMLHTGNDGNKQRLLDGRGWELANWNSFITRLENEGRITKADWDFCQSVWDLMESLKPAAQKAHRYVFGRYFNEITAVPFVTRFGEYRGGYVPASADARLSADVEIRAAENDAFEGMKEVFPSNKLKSAQERAASNNKPLLLDLGHLGMHIFDVIRFSNLGPAYADLAKILRNSDFVETLKRAEPQAMAGVILPWLNRAVTQQVETPSSYKNAMRILSRLRAKAGAAVMFGSVPNAIQQIFDTAASLMKVDFKYFAEAFKSYIGNASAMTDEASEKSVFMRNRIANEVMAMNGAINKVLINPGIAKSAVQWVLQNAYFAQSAVDRVMSTMVWHASYNQAIAQGFNEADAIRLADSNIRTTQGSNAAEDISSMESGNAALRLFTQFAGFFINRTNTMYAELSKLDGGIMSNKGRASMLLLKGYFIPMWFGEAIMVAMAGGPDRESDETEFAAWMKSVFGFGTAKFTAALAGPAGIALRIGVNQLNKKPYDDRMTAPPALAMVENSLRVLGTIKKQSDGKDVPHSRYIRDLGAIMAAIYGVPTKPIGAAAYLADVKQGKTTPRGTADMVRGVVTGGQTPRETKR